MQDVPSAPTGAEGPSGDVPASVTDVPLVPRTEPEAATSVASPVVDVGPASRPPDPPPPDLPPVDPLPASPLDPVAVAAMAQGGAAPPGLLYYAVYLPTPSGLPGGPPLYLPAPMAGASVAAGVPSSATAYPALPATPPPPAPPISGAPPLGAPPLGMQSEAARHNQKLLVNGIIAGVFLVHLPWLVYLFAVHACWGTFLEACYSLPAEDLSDPFAEAAGAPMLFARVIYLMLRVQAVLAGDWGQFSQAMQVSTGAGSFLLTKIVAANGLVAEGRLRVWSLAASCAVAFGLLFWAELHLLGAQVYPELGAQTVLAYVDQNLPVDFLAYSSVEASLKGYLQFLRLADALILGAALAMPTTRKQP